MVKSLLLLSALLGVNSMPVATNSNDLYYGVQEKQYQHTEDVGNTEVTYKYESNEVSSANDLVVGNIYHMDYDISVITLQGVVRLFFDDFYNLIIHSFITVISDSSASAISNTPYLYGDVGNVYLYMDTSSTASVRLTVSHVEFDFVYRDNNGFIDSLIPYISFSDFNIIESVEYIAPTTIFGHLAEVLGDNLYGGIPNVDNVIFSIGGQDITLKSWLVTSTCIVLAVVLITILCLFIRWLFKLFSNTILLR